VAGWRAAVGCVRRMRVRFSGSDPRCGSNLHVIQGLVDGSAVPTSWVMAGSDPEIQEYKIRELLLVKLYFGNCVVHDAHKISILSIPMQLQFTKSPT